MKTNSVFLHSSEIATVGQEVASKVLILKMEITQTIGNFKTVGNQSQL